LIPSAKDIADIARRREGTLAETSFPSLLRALAETRRTAVVRLARGPIEKHVVFDAGVPVECESNLLHESLGRVLVAQGKLAEADYQRALSMSVAEERSLAEVLIASQLVPTYDLFRVMQQSLAHKLLDVFAWREGTFRILADAPEVESPLRVNVGQLVVTGVLRFAPQAQVDAAIGALVGQALGVHPEPPIALESVRLGTKHSRAVQILRTRLRLDELMAKANLAPEEVTRLVYALAVLGIVAPANTLPAEVRPAVAPAVSSSVAAASITPPPAPQGVSAVSEAEERTRRDELMALYMRHRRGDAFDLLGLATSADLLQITSAYRHAAERVAPWQFTSAGLAPVADKAEELFLALARAYAELADGDARTRVLDRRKRAAAAPIKKRSDVYAIKTDLLDAAAQFTEGKAHKDAGRYAQALKLLDFAADCDVQNSEYRAEAAHCRFLDMPQAQAKRALDELAEALRADPGCAVAHYYVGQIRFALGDIAAARAAFKEALRISPADLRVQKALREVGV
jgi:tetratricopeptide (TPR) repeat protein